MSVFQQCQDVMAEYLKMREQGVSQEDACKGLEGVLREVFPLSKFGPRCLECDDSGWRERVCWANQRCGREWCAKAHPAHEHAYLEPCGCPAGDRHRARLARGDEALAAVGKVTKKPRSFTRFGA